MSNALNINNSGGALSSGNVSAEDLDNNEEGMEILMKH